MTASWGVHLLDTGYIFTQWLEHVIACSINYLYWYMRLSLTWPTLYIVNTVLYYIWWSYIVFQRNCIGRHISVSVITNRNYSFSLSLHLVSSHICFIILHTYIKDTITLLYHQWTISSSLSYFSNPCGLPITSAGKFKNFIFCLTQLTILYSTFTYCKNVS